MKHLFSIFIVFLLSCSSSNTTEELDADYIEQKLSFFDPFQPIWMNEAAALYNSRMRTSEYLRMLHETFKKIGYRNLVTNEERFSTIVKHGMNIRKPMNELIDSLIITYKLDTINSQYYHEFWNRRTKESNHQIVFEILQEVASELYEDHLLKPENSLVNDTLYQLIRIRYFEDSLTEETALRNFNYLKEIGMHQSAYHRLYERYRYNDINWNKESLVKELTIDSVYCCLWSWIEDDTK